VWVGKARRERRISDVRRLPVKAAVDELVLVVRAEIDRLRKGGKPFDGSLAMAASSSAVRTAMLDEVRHTVG
jgi:hypothetical protein